METLQPLFESQVLMRSYTKPWCFGGGWAIDGLIGKATRDHTDVDIVIWRDDQKDFRRQFSDWEWQTYVHREPRPWLDGEFLELPAHNAIGIKGDKELEMLMIEREKNEWWFRRNPSIRMLANRAMIPTPSGFNVLNPAIVLLFKSNRLDDKDHHDFENGLPMMEIADRAWLKQALATIDERHVWISKL